MGGTGLATAHSTRPLLPLSPRFEQGAQSRMEALQAQPEEEKRLREMAARMEADRQRNEAERQRMEQMLQWMQSFGERMGQPLPPELFPPPPPPATTPNQSAASNDVPHDSSHRSGWPTW